ncbi:MAG: histidine kinase [Saprospiraceae bacterium]|uniref:Histidine kinase n=1 Tax=Candidatus Opimibacter skivensis TaxID=2982028 RepID=A0A9D7XSD6_9BACT|nr:histidine kinase [Candidatus Opimibacter skivensis]
MEVSAQQYFRTELSVINGLGQGDVHHISQDSLGYVWITQQHGVARFNGREFIQIEANPADSTSLPTTEVYHITHLPDGNAWFSHQKGISFYNRKENRFTNYGRRQGLHCDIVNETFTDGDSILFAAHWYGYDRIHLNTWKTDWLRPFPEIQDSLFRHRSYNLPNHPKQNPYNSNQLFSIHKNDLYVLDKRTLRFTKLTDFQIGVSPLIKDAFFLLEYEWADSSNLLLNFFPNDGTVYTYNLVTRKLSPLKIIDGIHLWINKIQKTGDHTFLCAEQSLGAFRLWTTNNQIEIIDSTLKQKTFASFFLDRQGVLWVGEHGYAFRYEPSQIATFIGGSAYQFLTHITDPETGTIVAISYIDPKVLQFEKGVFKEISFPPIKGLSSNIFFHEGIHKFINLTGEYLNIFHPLTKDYSKIKLTGLKNVDHVNDFATASDGFYVAIGDEVYFIDFNGRAQLILQSKKRIYEVEVYNGKLFFSTLGHLNVFDLKQGDTKEILHLDDYTLIPLLVHRDILYILWRAKLKYVELDSPGYSIRDSGLDGRFPDQTFLQMNISGDDLLISAEFRMIRINTSSFKVLKSYSYLDQIDIGYWDDIFTTIQGRYYVSTDSKKIIAFPVQLKRPSFLSYQVEAIEINGKNRIFNKNSYHLDDDENNIVIKSDAVYTSVFDKLTYYYRNTTLAEDWIQMKSDILQLLNQKPGKYSIDLKVVDRYDQERIIEKAAVFEIFPAWYQSRWFYAFIILSCLALIYGLYQYRLKQIQKNYDYQTKLQQLEMTALKAKMNPHFIFNCLNSIKGLILIGDTDKAVNYIGTFSKLVRSSLDSSDEKLITLKEEIDIAENYLALEHLRFGSKLAWNISRPDEALLLGIKLPPFVLQPLIENAIVHGMAYAHHDGFVRIITLKEKDIIRIKIIDNGIGLTQAKKINVHKEHQTRKHLGVSLVQQRLAIIHASLKIYEHMDSQGSVAGTISEIIIPYPT